MAVLGEARDREEAPGFKLWEDVMALDIRITTLGAVSLELDGKPVPSNLPRKSVALLIYLACTGQPFSRETLADLLWESDEPGVSLNSLRVALAQIRPYFKINLNILRTQISFNQNAPYFLDVKILQDCLKQAARLAPDRPAALAELAQAVDLYKGPFFDGWYLRNCPRFEQWQHTQQQFYEQLILRALQELAGSYLTESNYLLGIKYVQRWLDLDSFNEEAHSLYLRLLFYSGQRQNAIEYYLRYQKLLWEELKIEPNRATTALYNQIKDGTVPAGSYQAASLVPGQIIQVSLPEVFHQIPLSSNFPFPVTSLVGRKVEIHRIRELLDQPHVRLLTLTGFGGIGKTRLATDVALELSKGSQFKDGIAFVPLAEYHSQDELLITLTQTLTLKNDPQVSLLDNLKQHLRKRRHLLILDNFEQIRAGASVVSELLRNAPGLKILVTSRERLDLYGEQLYPIYPLAVPGVTAVNRLDELLANPSVQLLVARIQAFNPDFELVATNAAEIIQICIRLEGLPLAIELAAAHNRTLSLTAMMRQLDRRIIGLAGGPSDFAARQRTIWATIDWSYKPLAPELQQTLRFMSVAAGSLDEQAISRIFDLSLDPFITVSEPVPSYSEVDFNARLNILIEKNLLVRTSGTDGHSRFGMLETLAEFAFEQLQANGEELELQRRHACYFTSLSEIVSPTLKGAEAPAAARLLAQNYAEIMYALRWAEVHDLELTLRLVTTLSTYWETLGYHQQARRYLSELLDRLRSEKATTIMKVLDLLAFVTWQQGDYPATLLFYQELLDYKQAQNDQPGIAEIKFRLSIMAYRKGDMNFALQLTEESLEIYNRLDDQMGLAGCYMALGALASEKGQFDQASTNHTKALAIFQAQRDQSGIITALTNLGVIASRQHDYPRARHYYEEGLRILESLDRPAERAIMLNDLGLLAVSEKNYGLADQYYEQALAIYEEIGQIFGQCNILVDRALVAYYEQAPALAMSYLARAFAIARKIDNVYLSIYGLAGVSTLEQQQNHYHEAAVLGEGALYLAAQHGFVIEDLYREPLERELVEARLKLGEGLYQELREKAQTLTLERLVEMAEESCQRPPAK